MKTRRIILILFLLFIEFVFGMDKIMTPVLDNIGETDDTNNEKTALHTR